MLPEENDDYWKRKLQQARITANEDAPEGQARAITFVGAYAKNTMIPVSGLKIAPQDKFVL